MYTSTRDNTVQATLTEALLHGLSAEGGLFVDANLGRQQVELAAVLATTSYQELAALILRRLLPDLAPGAIAAAVAAAYSSHFASPAVAPLVAVGDVHVLELFHGPTAAFKDFGLQLLPQLVRRVLKPTERVLVLTATSGDTGKAALAGFAGVPQTDICVFYPQGGVSTIQERQMQSGGAANTAVAAVTGNFDATQRAVKALLGDATLQKKLAHAGVQLTSANSINAGRLAPQVVYYFAAYRQMVQSGTIPAGAAVNFAVPTGNFGNVLAGYYAKMLGLPVHKLIVASNANNVLTEFLQTGRYDVRREFHLTSAPSMDIQVSSNLERLLYYKTHGDDNRVARYMEELNVDGYYELAPELLQQLQADFWGGYTDDTGIAATINACYTENGYLLDPHTAVGKHVAAQYQRATGDRTPTVVLATASPYKFAPVVLRALLGSHDKPVGPAVRQSATRAFTTAVADMDELHRQTGALIPTPLARLAQLDWEPAPVLEIGAMGAFAARLIERKAKHD